jgi:hypothetical protein
MTHIDLFNFATHSVVGCVVRRHADTDNYGCLAKGLGVKGVGVKGVGVNGVGVKGVGVKAIGGSGVGV